MKTTDVIVGVDGSSPSWDALRWAVDEARRRDSMLRIVSAYRATWPGEELVAATDLSGRPLPAPRKRSPRWSRMPGKPRPAYE